MFPSDKIYILYLSFILLVAATSAISNIVVDNVEFDKSGIGKLQSQQKLYCRSRIKHIQTERCLSDKSRPKPQTIKGSRDFGRIYLEKRGGEG
jgi:hypothetical protein